MSIENLIPIGSKCFINAPEYHNATVLRIMIESGNQISYDCVWWDGLSRRTSWLSACEISVEPPQFIAVGFLGGK